LIKKYDLTENQANSILNMRLRSLRRLEEIKIKEEYDLLKKNKSLLNKLIKSEDLQWKEISKEIKDIKKNFSKKTETGKRLTKISNDIDVKDYDYDFSAPAEEITVVFSKEGWIRVLKGTDHIANDIKFKDGDNFSLMFSTMSNNKILLLASNGKFFTIDVAILPSGRGFGDPLKLMIDLEDGEEIVSIHPFDKNKDILIVSKLGNGFVVSHNDILSNRKSGKQVLNLSEGDKAKISSQIKGKDIAVIGENKKMIIYSLDEIPVMSRGKGVKLQRYKEGFLAGIISFNIADGLNILDKNGRNRFFEDINDWVGKRGQAGKKVPKGFPRNY